MTDPIEQLVAAARERALKAREDEAARERAARAQEVEAERQVAELLLTRARPLLESLATSLNRQIEGGAWQVEWHDTPRGNTALRLESRTHPAQLEVEIGQGFAVTLRHRTQEHDAATAACELSQLEPTLVALLPHWLDRLMASARVRPDD
jgi:hypothetical protein